MFIPKKVEFQLRKDYLLSGELEKTNEPYAIAKIAGIKMCESYNKQYKRNYISLCQQIHLVVEIITI